MKKFTLAAVAALAVTAAPAFAADMPARAPVVKAPPPAVALFNWSGFYFGGQLGWLWGDNDYINTLALVEHVVFDRPLSDLLAPHLPIGYPEEQSTFVTALLVTGGDGPAFTVGEIGALAALRDRGFLRFAGIGGMFVGLVSTGLGELNSYALIMRCRIPSRIGVSTSVVVVAVTALAAGFTHLIGFLREGTATMQTVLSLVVFTVPGVLIGGQLGPQLTSRVKEQTLIRFLGWLFVGVALLTLGEVITGRLG